MATNDIVNRRELWPHRLIVLAAQSPPAAAIKAAFFFPMREALGNFESEHASLVGLDSGAFHFPLRTSCCLSQLQAQGRSALARFILTGFEPKLQ